MPRSRRPPEGPTVDPILEEIQAALTSLGDPFAGMSPAERKVAERRRDRRQAKWQRRVDKSVAVWHAMTVFERKAWTDEYLRAEKKRRGSEAKAPKAADLPLIYAVLTVARRYAAKAAAAREAEKATEAAREAQRPAKPAPPRVTRRAPAPEAPTVAEDTPKPSPKRRRRRGPAVGPVGQQIDGVFYPYVMDDDDD